jgi:ATP dependent DNA ligase domain
VRTAKNGKPLLTNQNSHKVDRNVLDAIVVIAPHICDCQRSSPSCRLAEIGGSGCSAFAVSRRTVSIERQRRKRCLFKYDGFRCLVRKVGARVDLISRQGNLMNRSFPGVVAAVERVRGDFVWDAELTVDEPTEQSSFERLQIRARTSDSRRVGVAMAKHPPHLYVFDMLP